MIILKRETYSDPLWNRSEHMKELHRAGRYAGTSKIGIWNQSQSKHDYMSSLYDKNRLDKTSHGYGSEYAQRVNNRNLLHNKFQGEEGYIYFLEFPKSVKVGFSKDWERRVTKQILGGKVLMIIAGPTNDLADLEFSTLIKFQEFTQLDERGLRYTEFIDKSQKRKVEKYLKEAVENNKNLRIL